MKKWLFAVILILVSFAGHTQSIVINEVSYSNKSILHDIDGNFPDWFEIYNSDDIDVDLAGYYVTDDTGKIHTWIFPPYVLKPESYLVVFASGKNRRNQEELHTDFKLRNMRESLFLFNPDNKIVDELRPSCIPTDCSVARYPDGADNLIVISPTPGYTNNHAEEMTISFQYDSLFIDYQSGFYNVPITVSLSNRHPDNEIRYTLDGDVPDEESPVYDKPLCFNDLTPYENRFANIPDDGIEPGNNISKANILRAVVYSNGCPASQEICNTYFIGQEHANRYKVPVVSLITEKDNLFDDETGLYVSGHHTNCKQRGNRWERKAHIEIFDSTGVLIIDQDADIRIHGRRSRQLPQKSFRLYAGKQDDTKYFQYPFFSQKPELMQFKTLLLRATNGTMGSLIKNELCNSLVQYMNIDFLAGETVIAFINGEYWGIYNLTERNDRYYVENNYGLSHCDLDIIGYSWQLNIEEGDSDAYNRLVAFLQNADPESGTFYDEISKKIDIENLIDYYAAQFYFANFDWPKNNLELWRIKSDTCQWRYFFFDPDAAMIHAHYNQIADHKNTLRDYRKYPEFSTLIFETLIKNEAFKREFESVFLHNLKTTFNADRVISMINHYERIYSPLVPENIYRWHNPTDYITWGKNIELLRRFAIQRPVIIAEQLQNNYEHPFMVFPNPSTESFYIDFLYPVNTALLKIYSINGAQLFQQHIDGLQDSLFQPQVNLPPGLYLMHIIIDGIACAQKFIIQ